MHGYAHPALYVHVSDLSTTQSRASSYASELALRPKSAGSASRLDIPLEHVDTGMATKTTIEKYVRVVDWQKRRVTPDLCGLGLGLQRTYTKLIDAIDKLDH